MVNTAKPRPVTAHTWIDQKEERSRLTHEALVDVDAGRVIEHQVFQTWADSLSTDTPLPLPSRSDLRDLS